jgi:AmmeMemoRadiSam system protein A
MFSLGSRERGTLLEIARQAAKHAVEQGRCLEILPAPGILSQPAGAFVTLRRAGQLRGCIGQLEAIEPVVQVVARCAMAAALQDPRFAPLSLGELPLVKIEVSVLSALAPIRPEEIEVGKHGLLINLEGARGVLLPQVAAEHHWTREKFLEEACAKGGLEHDAWKNPATRIQAFTAEVFSEDDETPEAEKQTRSKLLLGTQNYSSST